MTEIKRLPTSAPPAWMRAAGDAVEAGDPAVLVFILRAMGSTPRETDAWMLIGRAFDVGTIGGGNLEHQVMLHARRMLDRESRGRRTESLLLGPDLEQCCGGAIEVLYQPVGRAAKSWLQAAPRSEHSHLAFSLIDLEAPPTTENSDCGSAIVLTSDRDRRLLVPLSEHPDRVIIYGAGHVGLECARLMARLPFAVTLIDPRPERRAMAADLDNVAVRDLAEGDDERDAFVLVMSHDHQLDFEICARLLRANRFRFLGLIGSKSKAARFRKRLRAAGIPAAALDRLTSPIGLASITGKEPAVIAIAATAQILELQGAQEATQVGSYIHE